MHGAGSNPTGASFCKLFIILKFCFYEIHSLNIKQFINFASATLPVGGSARNSSGASKANPATMFPNSVG